MASLQGRAEAIPPALMALSLTWSPVLLINRQQRAPWMHQPGPKQSSPAPSSRPTPREHPLRAPHFPVFCLPH